MLPTITKHNIMRSSCQQYGGFNNVGQYLIEELSKQPKTNVVIVDSQTGLEKTVETLLQEAVAVTEWLRKENIGEGAVVGFCAVNRLEFPAIQIATLAVGGTCAPFNPAYTIDEIKHTLGQSKPRLIFCSSDLTAKISDALTQLPNTCHIISLDDMPLNRTVVISYNSIVNRKVDVSSFRSTVIDPKENVGVILCSSGTTGFPKCVQLTHANLMCFIQLIKDPQTIGPITEKDAILGLPPFFHGYGFGLMLLSAATCIKLVAMAKFSEQHYLETIQNHRITMLFIVPPTAVLLAKSPLVDRYDLSSVRMIRCGAAPLSRDVQSAAKKRFNNVNFGQLYGMTEISIACVVHPWDSTNQGSVGVVSGGMECKIADPETGKALAAGKKGEVCFRGPFVMKGYVQNQTATDETIKGDGWLHTGDIGFYDTAGYLYIVDRLKELIKYKGFQLKVAPAELEAILLTHPDVRDAGVIGIPDEAAGELPYAFIVRQPGSSVTEKQLQKFVAEKVSPQKRISGGVSFVKEIPKNPSGKILRRNLRSLYTNKPTAKL